MKTYIGNELVDFSKISNVTNFMISDFKLVILIELYDLNCYLKHHKISLMFGYIPNVYKPENKFTF